MNVRCLVLLHQIDIKPLMKLDGRGGTSSFVLEEILYI